MDEGASERLSQISSKLVVGACSGGEVSTATFAFDDGSFLILMDHGLANLTFFSAALYVASRNSPLLGRPVIGEQVDSVTAARAIRLAVAWVAAGGRAGQVPPLKLTLEELEMASLLVAEMDVFVLGHEAAHILLNHFAGERKSLGMVGGTNRLLGKGQNEELSADILGTTLMFDDMLESGTGSTAVIELRITAIRLFLATLEMYEQSCFLTQPSSHPPAGLRWQRIVDTCLNPRFPELSEELRFFDLPSRALDRLRDFPRWGDADAVRNGLGKRLDTPLWRQDDWKRAAELSFLLCATTSEALAALTGWSGWLPEEHIGERISALIKCVLETPPVRDLIRETVVDARTVTRLEALEIIAAEVNLIMGQPEGEDPFPNWAIAIILIASVRGMGERKRANKHDDPFQEEPLERLPS
ncbi:hypothetical protein [Herbidospora daliensis]|uniref:hypothetical protein n=1 Tax=Herbidospora daliensis TaxID=295585 RepID=UPI0012F89220|nr:hypothetical protein [Herbidospora daliensis]